jgi:hypothetical protein
VIELEKVFMNGPAEISIEEALPVLSGEPMRIPPGLARFEVRKFFLEASPSLCIECFLALGWRHATETKNKILAIAIVIICVPTGPDLRLGDPRQHVEHRERVLELGLLSTAVLDREAHEVAGRIGGRHLDDGHVPSEVIRNLDRLLRIARRIALQAIGVGMDGLAGLLQGDADRGAVQAAREEEGNGVIAAPLPDGIAQQ